jgi:hypothetical protein
MVVFLRVERPDEVETSRNVRELSESGANTVVLVPSNVRRSDLRT